MRGRGILLFATLAAFASAAWAQDARGLDVRVRELAGEYAVAGKQYVALIAIDRYRSWTGLKNPVKDAKEIKEILTRRYYVDEFLELYDTDATKADINRLFRSLVERTKPEDSVLIFYAGHGYLDPLSSTGFWIPVDGGMDKDAQENWLPTAQIRGIIGSLKARHVALVSDSCFSGDILNPTRGRPEDITSEYFRNAYQRVSRQVLTSGASESVPDASAFAQQLKLALEGNQQPYLDPLMLYNDVRLGVSGTTPLFGALKESGHQDGGSFLLFLKDRPAAAPSRQPTVTVTVQKAYGSVQVDAKIAGDLYLDGVKQASLPSGASARLDNVETGNRGLEMRFSDGKVETKSVKVTEHETITVSFAYAGAAIAQPSSGAPQGSTGAGPKSTVISLQNGENTSFYFVIDPAGLAGLAPSSAGLQDRVAAYFSTESADFAFMSLQPKGGIRIEGLPNGAHLLVGFFATEDRGSFPVRVIGLTVDSNMGERFYGIYSDPAYMNVERGKGRLSRFAEKR
jgi:hypothetical protein